MSSWLRQRSCGMLLHPTALPGPHGVGTLGGHAKSFVSRLARLGMRNWQVCPTGPTGYGNSPYASFSAFALNPYLIDIEALIRIGWMTSSEAAPLESLPFHRVDFGGLYRHKWPVLRLAHARWKRIGRPDYPGAETFDDFRKRHAFWLQPFAAFMALKESRNGECWNRWPAKLRSWSRAKTSKELKALADAVECQVFLQYAAFAQWNEVRAHAAGEGVRLIGDIPLFVAYDSADVWTSPELFQIDPESGDPEVVAGVPPDYFSADGQLWGNPLYNWTAMRKDGFAWWMERLGLNFALFDVVRIDHFRGFDTYWAIPAGAPNARGGEWKPGPGIEFFRAVEARFPEGRLIAEDLGALTESVHELRRAAKLPGMAILQFAFGGDAANLYLPHNHEQDCVVYPGTHDNPTNREWYSGADEKVRDHFRRYLRVSGAEASWDLIRAAYQSPARLAVTALQDFLDLGAEARFNTPGRADGNWEWRVLSEQLDGLEARAGGYLRELAALYGR